MEMEHVRISYLRISQVFATLVLFYPILFCYILLFSFFQTEKWRSTKLNWIARMHTQTLTAPRLTHT